MDRFADRSLASLLGEFAAPTPAPGGGSAAACTCALAATLVEMAAALEGSGEGKRMRLLREHALELAERELGSYAPVLEARRLPRDDPERPGRIDAALADASGAPLAIAEAASEVAELGAGLATEAGPAIRGDVLAGVLLAEAAAAASAALVEINLEGRPGAEELARAREAADRAAAARRTALRPEG
jgi:glutamate formiminotransferase/formiminotetrahydrofolate cyclodeaminase